MIPCPRIESFSSNIESESKPVRRWVKDDHKEQEAAQASVVTQKRPLKVT